MKNKEIPNFVFTREYDYYFLFTELDIVFDYYFYENFDVFLKKIGSEKLIIRFDDISEFQNIKKLKKEYVYDLPLSNQLEQFHNLIIEDLPIFNINHFILDNNHQWEIFVSMENELSIFAVNKNLIEAFEAIFKPYKDEPLSLKFKLISDQFNNEKTKKRFISDLDESYKFTSYKQTW